MGAKEVFAFVVLNLVAVAVLSKLMLTTWDPDTNTSSSQPMTAEYYLLNHHPDRWKKQVMIEYLDESMLDEPKKWTLNAIKIIKDYFLQTKAQRSLSSLDAAYQFLDCAVKFDIGHIQYRLNLAVFLLITNRYDEALTQFNDAQRLIDTAPKTLIMPNAPPTYANEVSMAKWQNLVHLFRGLTMDKLNGNSSQVRDCYAAIHNSPQFPILDLYSCIARREYDNQACKTPRDVPQTTLTMLHLSTIKYFCTECLANPSMVSQKMIEKFQHNMYIVLSQIISPYVIDVLAEYYREMNKILPLDDQQSKRYHMWNDPVSHFYQMHLTDLVRTIVLNNVNASYTYYGGYVEGSNLAPHVDRKECMFTLSLSIENYPQDFIWPLGLNKIPDKQCIDDIPMCKENSSNDVAHLRPGDALLFMGRFLTHYRLSRLEKDQWVNQVFLHYVEEGFRSS